MLIVSDTNSSWNRCWDQMFRCSKESPMFKRNELHLTFEYTIFYNLWSYNMICSMMTTMCRGMFRTNLKAFIYLKDNKQMRLQRDKMFVSIQQKTDALPCYRKDDYHVSNYQTVLICAICYGQNASAQFVQNIMWQKSTTVVNIAAKDVHCRD